MSAPDVSVDAADEPEGDATETATSLLEQARSFHHKELTVILPGSEGESLKKPRIPWQKYLEQE